MKPPLTPTANSGEVAVKVLRSGSRLLNPTFASNSKRSKVTKNPSLKKGAAAAGLKGADVRRPDAFVRDQQKLPSNHTSMEGAPQTEPDLQAPPSPPRVVKFDSPYVLQQISDPRPGTEMQSESPQETVVPPFQPDDQPSKTLAVESLAAHAHMASPPHCSDKAQQSVDPAPVIPAFDDPVKEKNTKNNTGRSYATTAAGSVRPPDVFASGYTDIRPVKQGNAVSISIPDNIYKEQLNAFRFSIIGRMVYRKGDKPLSPTYIKEEIQQILSPADTWTLIAMGRSFYTLKFGCDADLRTAARRSMLQFSTGVMFMRDWTPDFDPFMELSSMAHVWVKAYNLPAFYWHPQVLTGLISAAGKVIKLDGNTMSGTVGQYIRALVEVDLAQPLVESVKVGCGESSFLVELVYENLPYFCSLCKIVGHSLERCHKNKPVREDKQQKDKGKEKEASVVQPPVSEQWKKVDRRHRCSPAKRDEQVPTKNSFDALANETEGPVEPTVDRVTVGVQEGAVAAVHSPEKDQPDQRSHSLERMQVEKFTSANSSVAQKRWAEVFDDVVVVEELVDEDSGGDPP